MYTIKTLHSTKDKKKSARVQVTSFYIQHLELKWTDISAICLLQCAIVIQPQDF